MKNETKFCQSCGMPLNDEVLGTNVDGSKSDDYCIYCYKDGAFTGDFTMEEMVEYCSMFVDEYNKNTGQNLTACQYKEVLPDKFCNPMVMWGKYRKGFFKTELPISFQFHHVQMDGAHAGKFLAYLQKEIKLLQKYE